MTELETCGKCTGSGYGGHPDSGALCADCNGTGGVPPAPREAPMKPDDLAARGVKVRPIRVEGDVAYVPLTKGYEAIIDAADAHLVQDFNWHAQVKPRADNSGVNVYAVRNAATAANRRVSIGMHRVIAWTPENMETDHIDLNGLNNRRANLRNATRVQNGCNQGMTCRNTSGAKGVTWNRRLGKWQAQIGLRGKTYYLGLYEAVELAAAAYAKKSAELHGEFGRTT